MNPDDFSPVPRFVGLGDDGDDGRIISPSAEADQKEDGMKGQIVLCPLQQDENNPRADESGNDGPLASPDWSEVPEISMERL